MRSQLMSDRVSGVLYDWLRAEARTSGQDQGRLDDYAAARRELQLPFSAAGQSAERQRRRHSRFGGVMTILPQLALDNDDPAQRFKGSIAHHALMFVSGGFRLQCMLQAPDADAYMRRRRDEGRAAGVNIARLVGETFFKAEDLGLQGDAAVERFVAYGHTMNDAIAEAHAGIYGYTLLDDIGLLDESPPVRAARSAQEAGIRLAAGSIAFMLANLGDGDYGAVPFLTPQPVANADVYYPLAA